MLVHHRKLRIDLRDLGSEAFTFEQDASWVETLKISVKKTGKMLLKVSILLKYFHIVIKTSLLIALRLLSLIASNVISVLLSLIYYFYFVIFLYLDF